MIAISFRAIRTKVDLSIIGTCLDIAAQQECDAQCDDDTAEEDLRGTKTSAAAISRALQQIDISTETETGCCSSKTRPTNPGKKPCTKHLKAAHERYATTLETIGCICKALIARNLESCCSSGRNRTKRSRGHAVRTTASCSSLSLRGVKSTSCSEKACGQGGGRTDCCGATDDTCGRVSPAQELSSHKSCSSNEGGAYTKTALCDSSGGRSLDACCSKLEPQAKSVVLDNRTPSCPRDIEKSTVIVEHVTLNVEGLTCVGCENKLFRSLNTIPGIRHLQTSLVMSQAEFDVDTDASSVSSIIREVARATGFACQRVRTQGQSLDVLASGDARDFINQKRPHGVEEMAALDKRTVRITYDAKLVGARDLLNNTFNAVITLAPPRAHAELESGGKHVRQTAYMTVFSAALTIPVLSVSKSITSVITAVF
jgi:copper chaperone CopZ